MELIKKEVTYRIDGEEVTEIIYTQHEYDYIVENFDVRSVKTIK